ncbi:hyalin-like [Amphiura filiformis]|uniref:hyalin-like n=1 Tax=Amphiura filiformis TaxID=82378 RepID=UPI003B20CC3E
MVKILDFIPVFLLLVLAVQFQCGNTQEGTTAVLLYNGEPSTAFNTVIDTAIIVGCRIEKSLSEATTITWNIEGTDTQDTIWSVASNLTVIGNIDGLTWDISEEVEIITSRHNCPGITIQCVGNNTFGEYSISNVLDVYAAPVGSVLYTGAPENRKKRSSQIRTSRQVSVEGVIDGEDSYFTCEAWEANPVVDINWFIDDVQSNENVTGTTNSIWSNGYPPNHYTYDTYSYFRLTTYFPEHQGVILSCTASNVADPMGISKEISLDVTVLPSNVQVFVNDVEVTDGSTVVLEEAQPAEFRCFVEGAKPAATCYLVVNGVPSPLQGAVTTNPTSELLSDTTAVYETTPSLSNDGHVWDFIGYNGQGGLDTGITIILNVRSEVEAPVIFNTPDDITQNTDPNKAYATVTWMSPSATDNSGSVTLTSSYNPGDTFPIGVTKVTYTAIDSSNNMAESSFNITVTDQEPPDISCPDDIEERARDGENVASISWSIPSVSDNSGGESIILQLTEGQDPGSDFVIGNHSVTYLATDEAGNENSCTFIVLVVDQEPPDISCPDDIEERARDGENVASISWSIPSVSDNSGGESIILQLTEGQDPGSDFVIGNHSVTYLATDEAGNENSCTFIVLVVDQEPPDISCPDDIEERARDGENVASISWSIPSVSDNSGGESIILQLTEGQDPGSDFVIGNHSVTYLATDEAGNENSCTFIVLVVDLEQPAISCPDNIDERARDGENVASISWSMPSVSDNSGGESIILQLTEGQQPGSDFVIGNHSVTYLATDEAGNENSCTFIVLVVDLEQPAISCPDNIDERARDGENVASISWSMPSVSDNSGGESIILQLTEGQQPGSDFVIGNHSVTYLATDEAGNQNSCTFIVLVVGK